MIIIGYQGIGKSSLSAKNKDFIDLESSCFRIDGVRADDWYKAYGNIALDLSLQGYNVFTASHAVVREWLGTQNKTNQKIIICYPAKELRDDWVKKLEERYERSKLDKDFSAWKNAEDRYADNIQEMIDDADKYGFGKCCITSMDYDLEIDLQHWLRDSKQDIEDLKLLQTLIYKDVIMKRLNVIIDYINENTDFMNKEKVLDNVEDCFKYFNKQFKEITEGKESVDFEISRIVGKLYVKAKCESLSDNIQCEEKYIVTFDKCGKLYVCKDKK